MVPVEKGNGLSIYKLLKKEKEWAFWEIVKSKEEGIFGRNKGKFEGNLEKKTITFPPKDDISFLKSLVHFLLYSTVMDIFYEKIIARSK